MLLTLKQKKIPKYAQNTIICQNQCYFITFFSGFSIVSAVITATSIAIDIYTII